jgi:hypothetical protein
VAVELRLIAVIARPFHIEDLEAVQGSPKCESA